MPDTAGGREADSRHCVVSLPFLEELVLALWTIADPTLSSGSGLALEPGSYTALARLSLSPIILVVHSSPSASALSGAVSWSNRAVAARGGLRQWRGQENSGCPVEVDEHARQSHYMA